MKYCHIAKMKISISMFAITLPLLYVSLLHVPPSTLFKDTTFWFLISNSIVVIVAADSGVFSSPHESTDVDDLYGEYVKHSSWARSSSSTNIVAAHRPQVTIEKESRTAEVIIKHVDDVKEKELSNESRHEHNLTPDHAFDVSSSESRHDHNLTSDCPVVVSEKEGSNEATEYQRSSLFLKRSATADEIDISRSEMPVKNRDFMRNKTMRRSATEKRNSRLMEETEYWRMSDEELNKRVEDFISKFNREIRLQAIIT